MAEKRYKTGETPKRGCYECTNCGMHIELDNEDKMPPCPKCNNTTYTKVD